MKNAIPPAVVDEVERRLGYVGKRTADVPGLAEFRITARYRFRRLTEMTLGLAVLAAVLALSPLNPLRLIAWLALGTNIGTMCIAEIRAAQMTRQLERRAAEQLLRDLHHIGG